MAVQSALLPVHSSITTMTSEDMLNAICHACVHVWWRVHYDDQARVAPHRSAYAGAPHRKATAGIQHGREWVHRLDTMSRRSHEP